MVNGHGDVGVPDMVTISDIDEHVINKNLKKRYAANKIYVSIKHQRVEFYDMHRTTLNERVLAGAKIQEHSPNDLKNFLSALTLIFSDVHWSNSGGCQSVSRASPFIQQCEY